jgi:hypothetical protein
MKPLPLAALLASTLLLSPPAAAQDKPGAPAAPAAWVFPQDVKCAGRRLTLHEPQVVAADPLAFKLSLRFPTTLTDPLGRATWGTTEVSGAYHADLASRLLRLDALEPGKTVFPAAAKADAEAVEKAFGDSLPKFFLLRIELLTARPGAFRPDPAPSTLPKDPPQFVVRGRPAVLVQVDGAPVMQEVIAGNDTLPVEYLANSATDVFRDVKTDMWYLLVDGSWMEAKKLEGPWKPMRGGFPSAMSQLPANHPRGHVRKFVPGTPEFMKRGLVPAPKELPEIILADKPSELVLLAGDPMFTLVPGLGPALMSVANTESDVFFHPKTLQYYLLVAGRWFSNVDLDGPAWTPVEQLPEEFAKIPRDYVRAHVLSCVPGTPEAAEACALAAVEDRGTINKFLNVEVLFDGKGPAAAPLEGDVKIVTNTEDDCFVVGGTYYVCQRGVWARSESGKEKWTILFDLPEPLKRLSDTTGVQHVNACRPLGVDGDVASFGLRGAYYGTFVRGSSPVYGAGVARRGMLRNGNWYPAERSWGENRWYDPATGVFQPRSVKPRKDGSTTADDWSPYVASYGRVVYYGCRYDQGGRRMFQWTEDDGGKFDVSAERPNIWTVHLSEVKKREGLDPTLFPFGDRSSETAPAEPRVACEESGRVWRVGAKAPEAFEKGDWKAMPCPPEVLAWLDALARIDARPAQWKRWREQRAAGIPVNPVYTPKGK